jgi:flagellin-like protein
VRINKISKAVSPVISVVLLVAVTVSLVSLVSFTAFDTIDNTVEEKADATVEFSFQENNGTNRIGYLNAELSSNQNLESVIIETPSSNTTVLSEIGQTTNMTIYAEGTARARIENESFNQVISSIKISID